MCKGIFNSEMSVGDFLQEIDQKVRAIQDLSFKIIDCLERRQFRSFSMDVSALEEYIEDVGKLSHKYSRMIVRQLAETGEEDKMTLSATIHDLNNMLGVIVGYADLIVMDCKNRQYDRAVLELECILEASASATQIIEATSLKFESIDLIESLKAVIKLNNSEDDIRIITNFPQDDIMVKGDKIALHSVFLNLVTNAIYAMRQKRKKDSYLSDQDQTLAILVQLVGKFVHVELIDNGEGIEPSLHGEIFKPRITTKGSKGTGMGLYSCKKILTELGGKISFQTWFGKGTTFRLEIPMVC